MKKNIQLIGIENSTYYAMKDQLTQFIQSFDGDLALEEVVNVDAIVNRNLRRIPAIAINNKIVFQYRRTLLELEELTKLLQPHL